VDTLSSKPEGMPRYKTRTAADNKKKLDRDDLLALYSVLDGASV